MRFLAVTVAAVAMFAASPVQAGDDWTGAYAGIIGSYVDSDQSVTLAKIDGEAIPGTTRDASPTGGLVGIQAGYGRQFGLFYAGLETDWQWGNLSDSNPDPVVEGLTEHFETDQMGTIRGRLGVIWLDFMPYVTGGLAIKHGEVGVSYGDLSVSASSWDVGYVVGGGVEWRPQERWSLKVEGLYQDFGEHDLATANIGGTSVDVVSMKDTDTLVRAGIAYHF